MKKLLTNTTKSAYKGIVFWTFFWLTVFSVAYAASITSTTDPTVSSWDSITANWYQDVNNKLWGISVSSGNVGIGTSSPQRKFVVSNNNEEGFEFYPGDSLGWNTINHYNRSTASFVNIINNADQHIFWRADGEKMRIDSYGRVGIGTKTPTEDLTIAGTKSGNQVTDATIDFGILNSNGDSKKAQIKAIGTADISSELIFSTTKSHSFWERMRIDENGNVWIWTTAPAAKLDVNWVIKQNWLYTYVFSKGSGNGTNLSLLCNHWNWSMRFFDIQAITQHGGWALYWSEYKVNAITNQYTWIIRMNEQRYESHEWQWSWSVERVVTWTHPTNWQNISEQLKITRTPYTWLNSSRDHNSRIIIKTNIAIDCSFSTL